MRRLDPWQEAGAKRTIALMDEHSVPPLSPAVDKELTRLLAECAPGTSFRRHAG